MEQEKDRQGPGMIFNGLIAFLSDRLDDEPDREKLSFWDLAYAGFRGINFVAGTDLRFEREYNQNGELVSMAFTSRIIEFQRSTFIEY